MFQCGRTRHVQLVSDSRVGAMTAIIVQIYIFHSVMRKQMRKEFTFILFV